MRLIDADFVKQKMNQTMDYQDLYLPIHFEQVLDESPTLSPDEVRGVVRCKDCKFGEHSTDGNGDHCVLCGNSMVFDYPYAHDPDWFCADGEMKGAEDGTTD